MNSQLRGVSAPVDGIRRALSDSWLKPYTQRLREGWLIIVLYGLVAGFAAALVSLALPNEYVARASVITDIPDTKGLSGTLAQVAGQLGFAGANLDQTGTAQFYSDLMRSRTVLEGLANVPFADPRSGRQRPLFAILLDQDSLTPRRSETMLRKLNKAIDLTVDARTGVIRIAFAAPSPELSAAALDSLVSMTNRFAVDNLQARARARRQFTQDQVNQAKADLEAAEDSLRVFIQKNRRIEDSPSLQFENSRLGRRVTLRQDLYVSLSRELEQAQIDELRNTPVLRIIDPPKPPARHERPRRRAYVLFAIVVGAALASIGLSLRTAPPAASR
jgi:uncharacterized protein involved in exopolysaccharide biosynthesis